MNNTVAGYIKTEHFMLRQWERKIEDKLLNAALNKLKDKKQQFLLVISRKIVKELSGTNSEVFVLVKGRVLVTCFYGDLKEFMNRKRDNHFKIVQ